MIRQPSLIREYETFYSGDPAIAQMPPNATAEEAKEHENRIRVARETGDWTSIVIDGQQPTRFRMKLLRGSQYRWLADQLNARHLGLLQAAALAFRASCRAVVNFGDLEPKFVQHAALGQVLAAEHAEALDDIDKGIVDELGAEALRRAQDVPPKS